MLIMKLTVPLEVEIVCSIEGCDARVIGNANFVIGARGVPALHTLGTGLRDAGWRLLRRNTGILQDPTKPVESPYSGYCCVCDTHGKGDPNTMQWKTRH